MQPGSCINFSYWSLVLCRSELAPMQCVIHAGQLFLELVPIRFLKSVGKFSIICLACFGYFKGFKRDDMRNIDTKLRI